MNKIGLIRFHSALSLGDDELMQEEKAFLSSIDPNGELEFVPASKDLPNLFFIQTGGSEIFFKGCYEDYPEPYCLLVQGRRNSLAAALEIKSYLDSKGKRSLLIAGDPKSMFEQIQNYARFFAAERALKGMKLGVIGTPSDWLIASNVDYEEAKKRLGIEIINIPMQEFLAFYDEHVLPSDDVYQSFLKKTKKEGDLTQSLYVYTALKRICEKHGLSGFTLRCFDLLTSRHMTSCLSFGILNDEGIVATCEGDVPAMITMALCKALLGLPSFMANPAEIDVKGRSALFAHCTCPFSMTKSFTLGTHFESGIGFGVRGTFDLGEMTLCKISPDLSKIRALPCKVTGNPVRPDLCRSQITLSFDEDIDCLLSAPYGNHCIFVRGNHVDTLNGFFAYLNGK